MKNEYTFASDPWYLRWYARLPIMLAAVALVVFAIQWTGARMVSGQDADAFLRARGYVESRNTDTSMWPLHHGCTDANRVYWYVARRPDEPLRQVVVCCKSVWMRSYCAFRQYETAAE